MKVSTDPIAQLMQEHDDALVQLVGFAEQHLSGDVVGRGLLVLDRRNQPVEHLTKTTAG